MTHHSEPAEAVARALHEHFGTSSTTTFTAREAGRQAAQAVFGCLSATPAPSASGGLEAVLAAYEAETRALPLGAASREKGDSAYNWRMSVVKDLRQLAARLASPAATSGTTLIDEHLTPGFVDDGNCCAGKLASPAPAVESAQVKEAKRVIRRWSQ